MKPALDKSAAPLLVVTFFSAITPEDVRAHFRELSDAAEEFGRVGVIVDFRDGPRFTPSLGMVAAREKRAVLRKSGDKIVGVAHVTHSAAARATLAAMQWLVPPPFPTLVTSSLDEARSWVLACLRRSAPCLGPAIGARRDARTVAGLARTIVAAGQGLGCPIEPSELDALGIPRGDLGDLDGYVPYGALLALVERLAARSGDEHIGLRIGATFVDAASFGVVGIAARCSANLDDAIARTVRYVRLIDENTEMTVSRDPAGIRVTQGPLAPLEWPRHYAEFALAAFLELTRAWTGVRFSVSSVGFRHDSAASTAEHERIFGCSPAFGVNENFMVIPSAMLAHSLPHGDAVQSRYFDARLDELSLARAVAPGPLADVRAAALSLLPQGTPTVSAIGARLGVSSRTLQRRLNERGVTFGDILDSARREAALAAIARPAASVQEIALSSGFVDVKAFRRAFVRWTGRSPSEYRKALP